MSKDLQTKLRAAAQEDWSPVVTWGSDMPFSSYISHLFMASRRQHPSPPNILETTDGRSSQMEQGRIRLSTMQLDPMTAQKQSSLLKEPHIVRTRRTRESFQQSLETCSRVGNSRAWQNPDGRGSEGRERLRRMRPIERGLKKASNSNRQRPSPAVGF